MMSLGHSVARGRERTRLNDIYTLAGNLKVHGIETIHLAFRQVGGFLYKIRISFLEYVESYNQNARGTKHRVCLVRLVNMVWRMNINV